MMSDSTTKGNGHQRRRKKPSSSCNELDPLPIILSQAEQDERIKRKMADADRIANLALAVTDDSKKKKKLDRDEKLKRKMAQADRITSSLLLDEPHPLEPSRRVSKQRDSVVMMPKAIAVFNEASGSKDDQLPEHEEFEDEMLQTSARWRMPRNSGTLSNGSGRVSSRGGGSERLSSVNFSSDEESSSGNKDCGQEIFEADVVLAANADDEEKGGGKLTHRRVIVGAVVVIIMIMSVIVAVGFFLTRDNSNNDSQAPSNVQSTTTRTPTLSPTVSPAPTFTTVPVTVIIELDDSPRETGWLLECDGAMIESFPIGSYAFKKGGDIVSETLRVTEGADCKFTIYDLTGDGMCCLDGRGSYQLYLAEEDELPNGFVAEGNAFKASETVEFVALASENS